MWTPPHSHTLTPRPKTLHPAPPRAHPAAQGVPGDPTLRHLPLRQPTKAKPQTKSTTVEPSFLSQTGRRSGRSWRGGRRDPVVPSPRRWVYLTQTSARLSLAALRRDSRCGVFVKPHSLILSFPSIQHPCTLLASGLCIFFCVIFFCFKRLEIFFPVGVAGVPVVTHQA